MPYDNSMRADDMKGVFLNRRSWVSFLSALQDAASYPKMLDAVKISRDWFTQGATQASGWLTGDPKLDEKLSAS